MFVMQIEFTHANGGHDSAVQCLTVEQQYLYSADWHGNIKVQCYCTSAANQHATKNHYCGHNSNPQSCLCMLTASLNVTCITLQQP